MAPLSVQTHNRDDWKCYLYDETECFRFQIEGSLCDDHARHLEQSRRTASSVIGSRPWVLTLGNVTRIEPLGRTLLHQWSREGVQIVANSPLLRSIARSIAGEPVRFRIGPQPSPAEAWEEYVDSAVTRIEHDLGHPGLAPRRVPHTRIRHHAEAVFVPGATLDQALRHAPDPSRSGCESCTVRVDDRHAYRVGSGKRIAVRRFIAITRFREQDGGVGIEMEAVGLAWDVPACLRWLTSRASWGSRSWLQPAFSRLGAVSDARR